MSKRPDGTPIILLAYIIIVLILVGAINFFQTYMVP